MCRGLQLLHQTPPSLQDHMEKYHGKGEYNGVNAKIKGSTNKGVRKKYRESHQMAQRRSFGQKRTKREEEMHPDSPIIRRNKAGEPLVTSPSSHLSRAPRATAAFLCLTTKSALSTTDRYRVWLPVVSPNPTGNRMFLRAPTVRGANIPAECIIVSKKRTAGTLFLKNSKCLESFRR